MISENQMTQIKIIIIFCIIWNIFLYVAFFGLRLNCLCSGYHFLDLGWHFLDLCCIFFRFGMPFLFFGVQFVLYQCMQMYLLGCHSQ